MNKKIIFPIVGAALLSGSLLGFDTTNQTNAYNNVNTNIKQSAALEQTPMQKAQDKLRELTGNTYTLIQGVIGKDAIHFKRDSVKDDIIAYKANGKLETIGIKINYEDLNGGKYQAKLKETWETLFPGEEPKYVNISESIYYEGTISSNALQNKQIYMQENGKVYGIDYAPGEAPASLQEEAAEVLSRLTDGKIKQGAKLDRMYVRDGKPNVYQYKYKTKTMNVSFAIEEQTLELLQADVYLKDGKGVDNYGEFQKRENEKSAELKKLTLDTLLENAVKDAKKMMDLDLKGYKGTIGANAWDEDYMTFTKEGAPSVTGRFNKDGSFSSFTVDKYNQTIDFYGMTIAGPPNEELKLILD